MNEAASNTGLPRIPKAAHEWEALGMMARLRLHWPEYLMEAGEMGLYLFFTCCFASLLQHPASPVGQYFLNRIVWRGVMGLAVGATVIALIVSPWGKQSGGHFNPAMTFAFYRMGTVAPRGALFYVVAQFSGARLMGTAFLASPPLVSAQAKPILRCRL